LLIAIDGPVEGSEGDTVYINCGVHVGTGLIDTITTSSSTSIFEITWYSLNTTTQVGGYLNFITARPNYYCLTNVLEVEDGTYAVVSQSINKPDASGKIILDVSEYLKATIGYTDAFGYDTLNWRDPNAGSMFNITYCENWTGYEGPFSPIVDTNLFYIVNSTKQIQQRYGSNMGEYVPFKNYEEADIRAKFLSDFARPTYFPGYPFSLGFIYSDSIADRAIRKSEETYNVNGVLGVAMYRTIDTSQGHGVNRLMLSPDSWVGTVGFVKVWLEVDPLLVDMGSYFASGYGDSTYTEESASLPPVLITAWTTER
jgi:hypothetical protein